MGVGSGREGGVRARTQAQKLNLHRFGTFLALAELIYDIIIGSFYAGNVPQTGDDSIFAIRAPPRSSVRLPPPPSLPTHRYLLGRRGVYNIQSPLFRLLLRPSVDEI